MKLPLKLSRLLGPFLGSPLRQPAAAQPIAHSAMKNTTRYVITLVHGTFAPEADWTHADKSLLIKELTEELGGPDAVRFDSVTWRGMLGTRMNNGHIYRLNGATKLQERLRTLIAACDQQSLNAKLFLIGHSHGGNVILYALRDQAISERIAGVVTLATPFINCTPRNIKMALEAIGGAITVILFFFLWATYYILLYVLIGFIVTWTLIPPWSGDTQPYGLLAFMAAPALVLVSIGFFWKLFRLWIVPCFAKLQAKLAARLHAKHPVTVPLFCIAAEGDEVRKAFDLHDRIFDWPVRMWNYRTYAWIYGIITVVTVGVEIGACLSGQDMNWIMIFAITSYAGFLAIILFGLLHLLLIVLSSGSRIFGYGRGTLIGNMITTIETSETPAEARCKFLLYPAKGKGLHHSSPYTNEQVLKDIADWFRNPTVEMGSSPDLTPP